MTDTALADGHIVGIAGPVIDAEFPWGTCRGSTRRWSSTS